VLLTGLVNVSNWFNPDKWTQEEFVNRFGDYDIRVDIGTEGDKHTRSVKSYMDLAPSSNRTYVGFGWNTVLESDIFGEARRNLPPVLEDFDFRPVVSVAAATGSAGTLHGHEHTWFALLRGTKAWWISSSPAPKAVLQEGEHPTTHPCRWLEEAPPRELKLKFCLQQAGEIVYFADGQHHATCNLEDFVLGIGAQGHIPEPVTTSEQSKALQRALYRGNADAVQDLLARGGVNEFNEISLRPLGMPADSSYTPLHHAANLGHSAMAALLVKQSGMGIDAVSKFNMWRPLVYAATEGHAAVAQILLRHGARVNSAHSYCGHEGPQWCSEGFG